MSYFLTKNCTKRSYPHFNEHVKHSGAECCASPTNKATYSQGDEMKKLSPWQTRAVELAAASTSTQPDRGACWVSSRIAPWDPSVSKIFCLSPQVCKTDIYILLFSRFVAYCYSTVLGHLSITTATGFTAAAAAAATNTNTIATAPLPPLLPITAYVYSY